MYSPPTQTGPISIQARKRKVKPSLKVFHTTESSYNERIIEVKINNCTKRSLKYKLSTLRKMCKKESKYTSPALVLNAHNTSPLAFGSFPNQDSLPAFFHTSHSQDRMLKNVFMNHDVVVGKEQQQLFFYGLLRKRKWKGYGKENFTTFMNQ